MMAILTENYAGKWPLWLSPRQVMVVPVAKAYDDYAQQVKEKVFQAGFFAEADCGPDTLNKKVRTAQVQQYNYIFGTRFFSFSF